MFRFFDWRFALFLFVFLAGCSVPLQDRSVCGDGVCSPDEALSCEIDCGYLKQQVGAAGTDFGLSDVVNPELPLANVSIDFQPYNPVPNQSTNIEVMAFLPSSVSENSSLQKLIIDFGDGSSAERVCSGASCSGDNCSVCSASFVKSYSSQGRYLVVVRALASNGVFGLGSNFLEVSYADTTFSCNDVQPGAALVGLSENGEPVGVSQLQASGFLFSSFDSLGSKSSVSYKPNVLFGRDFSSAIDENRVSLIVQFNSSSILEKARELGFDLDEFVKRPEAKLYFDYLLREHDATLVALSKFFNGFEKKASLFNVFNGAIIEVDVGNFEEAIAEAERLGVVKKVYPNVKVQMDLADSVPYIKADQLWALKDASGNNLTGKGVRVSVIDSGVDYRHSYLGGCFGASCKVIGGYDVINNDNDPMDDAGHGTHVAGIIAANGRFFKGVAPDVKLLAYKVFDKGGRGTWGSILRGLDLSMDPNGDRDYSDRAHVINLSLGGPGNQDSPFSVAIDNFVDNGVVVVAAAGNYMPNGYPYMGSPGSSRKAITVGASINRDVATFSMNGPIFSDDHGEVLLKPDIVAPGVNICSTLARGITKVDTCRDHPGNRDYGVSSGTSMATPHISGLAAILKQAHPDWSPDDIKGAIVSSGVDTGLYSHFVQGNGVVDAVKALNAKVITDPVSLAFISLPPYETQVKNFKIKNIGDSSVGVKIVAPTLVYQSEIDHYNSAGYDSGFDTIAPLAVIDYRGNGFNVNFSTSKNTICLSPKSFDEISLSLPSIISLKSGYYTTALKLEVYSTCDFREKINETTMPIGLVKFNKLVLNFTPKSNQVGETFVRDLYLFTKDYYLPQRSLKLGPNENVKELFFVDGSYDVVYVKGWKDGPWYRINSGGAMYVVREIDASKTSNGVVTLNINENEVPLLQDNFESILRESNLEFYGKFLVFGKEITSFREKPNLMFFSGFYDLHGCPSLKKVDYYFSVSDSSRNKWPAYFGYHAKDKGKSFYNAQNLLMAGAHVNDLRNITNLNLGSISNDLKRQVSFFKPFKNEIENFVLFSFNQAIPSGIISVGIGGEINPDIKKTLYYTHPMFGVSRISYDVSKDKKFDMAYGQTFTGSLYSNPGDFELLKPPIKASFVEDKLVELGPNLEPLTSLSILFEDSGNKPQLLNKPDWHRLLLNQIYGTYFGGINRISIKRPDNKIIVINNLNERTLRCIYITEGKSNICDEGKYEFTFEFSSVDDPYVIKAEAYYYRTNGWNLVENPAPIVSLSTSKNSGLVEGERISFEVSASDPNGSIAWVDFYDNGVKVGRVERSPYRFETTLTKGTHEIIAYAFDDFGAIGSSSVISLNVAERVSPPTEEKPSVSPSPQPNVPPSVSLVSPVDGVSFVAPARVVLGAVASDVDGRVVRVDFYSGSVLLGSDSVAPFEFVWDGVGVGSYVVSARAVDDRGGVGVSGSVSFSVVAPEVPNRVPSVSLVSPVDGVSFVAPARVVLGAVASDVDGRVVRVDFYSGS
ncbi:MAG: S8 family serine peptidase, partial [Candidatus Diapherotrites archaeon]